MIKIINVAKNFKRRKLFQDLNLEIPLNQMTFILGKSGSGKSTILNLLGSIEKVDSGKIVLETEGKQIDLLDKKNRFLVDYIFQEYNLLRDLTAFENIKVGNNVIGKHFEKKKATSDLEKVNFNPESYVNKAFNLSGGEQQRVAILRALSRDSQILLVDEPTGNLDLDNSKIIFETLKEISKTRTVIVVTHDVKNAETYADNIVKVRDGRIESFEKVNENVENKQDAKIITDPLKAVKDYKWGNKWKITPMLVLSDIKKKWIQTSMIIFTFIVSIFSLVTFSLFLFTSLNIRASTLIQSNADIILVSKNREGDDRSFNRSVPLSKDDIQKINDAFSSEAEKITFPVFTFGSGRNRFLERFSPRFEFQFDGNAVGNTSPSQQSQHIEFELVDNSDFFKNRIESLNRTTGNFIQNDDDIIISEDIAKELKITNPIGQTVTLVIKLEKGTVRKDFKIVGMLEAMKIPDDPNRTGDNEKRQAPKEPKSYITFNAAKEIENEFKTQITTLFFQNNDNNVGVYNVNNPLASGVAPVAKNEILISNILKNNIEVATNKEVMLNDTLSFFTGFLGRIFNKVDTKVVGFFQEFGEPTINILTTQETKNDLLDSDLNFSAEVFVNPEKDFKKIIDAVTLDKSFEIIDTSESVRERILSSTAPLIIVSIIIFVLMAIITFVLVLTYSKLIVDGKKREIAILRLLGSKSLQVLFYHVANLIVINLIALVLVSILYYPAVLLLDLAVSFKDIISANPGTTVAVILVSWLVFSALTMFTYTLISLQTFRQPVKNLLY